MCKKRECSALLNYRSRQFYALIIFKSLRRESISDFVFESFFDFTDGFGKFSRVEKYVRAHWFLANKTALSPAGAHIRERARNSL